MKKKGLIWLFILSLICVGLSGCTKKEKSIKIGVSMGVGSASRWDKEAEYMQARALELGAEIEMRINRTDEPKTQTEDCIELIDSGIDVLILVARDVYSTKEIIDYAHKKNVKVISYARVIMNESVDLLVGYDSNRIGQKMGQYLIEMVYEGEYLILRGDSNDSNATILYDGAMSVINPIKDQIHIFADEAVKSWDPAEAKRIVKEAVQANQNRVDAILAPNDNIAGACKEALDELGIRTPVVITGMDADITALQRVVKDQQSCTIYMDLHELAVTAINEAYNIATGEKVNVNSSYDNGSGSPINANLITGQLVTKQNIDKIFIDSGIYTREEIYGK